jgi:hypothetical protein
MRGKTKLRSISRLYHCGLSESSCYESLSSIVAVIDVRKTPVFIL